MELGGKSAMVVFDGADLDACTEVRLPLRPPPCTRTPFADKSDPWDAQRAAPRTARRVLGRGHGPTRAGWRGAGMRGRDLAQPGAGLLRGLPPPRPGPRPPRPPAPRPARLRAQGA